MTTMSNFDQLELLEIPYLDDTLAWIKNNMREWRALQILMLDIAHEEPWRKRVKRDEICQDARKRGISIDLKGAWEFDHNLWSTIARFLIKYHPELDGSKGGILHIRKVNNGRGLPDVSWLPDLHQSYIVTPEQYQAHRDWKKYATTTR